MKSALAPITAIESQILVIREQRIMLDMDLATLYGVTIKRLNEQVKRNIERFPADFMFQLTAEETASLRSQFATLKTGRGQHRKYLPYAFTEHGAIMAANVLNSPHAIEASVLVVRAFVKMREALTANRELARKLAELERKLDTHDTAIKSLMAAIRNLMTPPEPQRRPIGFRKD